MVFKEEDTRDREFAQVLRHRSMIAAYCVRRGSRDPDGIAAETMSIAWNSREKLDLANCRPWLIVTARNLLMDEYRESRRVTPVDPEALARFDRREEPEFEVESLDPELGRALDSLSPSDREAVLLVAWEELTTAEAARVAGVRHSAFRVRLHRARRRLRAELERPAPILARPGELPNEENA